MFDRNLNIGIIGAGARARTVYGQIFEAAGNTSRIVCFHDPSKKAAEHLLDLPGGQDAVRVESFEEVVDHRDVNVVMIGTPNAFHTAPAVRAMEAGKLLYLEKPLAATSDDHHRLLQIQQRTNARVVLGFVLRYAPFYRKLKELGSGGRLGRIMTLRAEEHMSISLTADCYLRGWRADRKIAGPLLLEKCCHDIDIINWLLDVPCETVWAVSDRTVFVPRGNRPERCRACDDAECQYRAWTGTENRTAIDTIETIYTSDLNDYCVYNREKTIADHTTMLAKYRGGVHVAFNVTMGVTSTSRRIRITGSTGSVSGRAEGNSIVFEPLHREHESETIPIDTTEKRDHYGGDRFLAQEFIRLFKDPTAKCHAGIAAGFESGMICLAADESARTGLPINMEARLHAAP